MSPIAAGLRAALFLAYPFIVYAAYTRLTTRGVGLVLLGLYALSFASRLRGSMAELRAVLRQHLGLALLIALAIWSGEQSLLLLLPMGVSLYLLWTFAWSLREGPPMIERFARIVEDDLPDFTLPYCRSVTWVWCLFLGANSLCVAVLAFAAPLGWWVFYTGFLFYLLMGLLLVGEFVLRKLWFRYYGDGLIDRLFARIFPPERTANGRRSLAYAAQRSPTSSGAGSARC